MIEGFGGVGFLFLGAALMVLVIPSSNLPLSGPPDKNAWIPRSGIRVRRRCRARIRCGVSRSVHVHSKAGARLCLSRSCGRSGTGRAGTTRTTTTGVTRAGGREELAVLWFGWGASAREVGRIFRDFKGRRGRSGVGLSSVAMGVARRRRAWCLSRSRGMRFTGRI